MMKNLIFLLLLLVASCCKDPKPIEKENSFSCKINGELFSFKRTAKFPYTISSMQDPKRFDIPIIIPYSSGLGIKEFLSIGSVVKHLNKQDIKAIYDQPFLNDSTLSIDSALRKLNTYASFNNSIIGGDSRCERFLPDTFDQSNNWIRNTSEENNFKIVNGEFNLKLIKAYDCPDRNYPDTIRITEGKYHLNLSE
jgi:hypothetical protein